jgi:hypothetical protein
VHAPTFELPGLRRLASHALPHLVEATIVPLVLFYGAMWSVGMRAALGVALAWNYGAVLRRVLTGRRVPGILVIGALTMTARTVIALASGSVFLYFLQPTLGTIAVAAAFLVSVPAGRPLAERLAADFCPLPEQLVQHPMTRTFFARISVLWAFVNLANATVTLWLLFSQSVSVYLVTTKLLSLMFTTTAIAVSVAWFRRSVLGPSVTGPSAIGRPVDSPGVLVPSLAV